MKHRTTTTLPQLFKMSASLWNACPRPNSPLISRLINDRLLDAGAGHLTNCQ